MSIDPNEAYQKLVVLGEAWAEADQAASLLEETRKPVLSQLTLQSTSSSHSAKVTEAEASDEYRQHVRAMVEARGAANKAKVQYEAAKAWIDLLRTKAANERAVLKLAP